MKKTLLLSMLVISFSANSQDLKNTSWITYSSLFSDSVTIEFGEETLSLSGKMRGHIQSSIFSQKGDTVTLYDVNGSINFGCVEADTGIYFLDREGEDYFTLITVNDQCPNRGSSYNNIGFARIKKNGAGIDDSGIGRNVNVYPNPCNNFIKISGFTEQININCYTLLGDKVLSFNSSKDEITIDVSSLKKGIYILQIDSGYKTIVIE